MNYFQYKTDTKIGTLIKQNIKKKNGAFAANENKVFKWGRWVNRECVCIYEWSVWARHLSGVFNLWLLIQLIYT